MGNISIISNNPQVLAQYPQHTNVIAGGVYDVYQAARNLIHQGAVLINHPLSGSIKPNQSPYRSLVVSTDGNGVVDFDSLSLIEGAFITLRKLPELNRTYTEQVLDDFQVIDLDLLDAAIQALPAKYYF